MKLLVALCVLSMVALSQACIYVEGKCYKSCEEGTYSYGTGCGRLMPEPTCDVPNPQPEGGALCDFSACYCNPPTVRDTVSKKCVRLEECPKKTDNLEGQEVTA